LVRPIIVLARLCFNGWLVKVWVVLLKSAANEYSELYETLSELVYFK